MNILVVTHFQGDGSPSASFIHDQVKAFKELGHNVRCVISVPFLKNDFEGKRVTSVLKHRIVDGVDYYFYRYFSASRFGNKGFNVKSAIFFTKLKRKKILQGFDPDIIHVHTLGKDSEVGAYYKRITDTPLVITTHGSDTFFPMQAGRGVCLTKCINRASTVVCVSNKIANELLRLNSKTPIKVILNGYNKKNESVSIKKNKLLINQTGSLISRKNQDLTIKAVAILKKKYPDIRLDMVGSGPKEEQLKELCKNFGVDNNVTFYGQIDNNSAQELMGKARFFVMPSIREGFGIVYIEAMAAECITIGTEGEGIADFIRSGKNGFLIQSSSPESIAKVIEWCVENNEKAAKIAETGRMDAESLTWIANANRYIDLFDELIKRGR